MAHDVFVSYSHKDKVVADAIVSYLEFKGSRCWYAPRDIKPGADWAASIIDAIRNAKVMVLIFTDYSNASQQVAREVNNAVANGVTIIPFKMTESLPTEGMQYYLSTVHWLDALSTPLDRSIKQLDAQVRAVLTGEPVSVPSAPAAMPPMVVVEKKRPAWMIPVIAAVAVLAIVGVIFLPKLIGGSGNAGTGGQDTQAVEPSGSGTETSPEPEPEPDEGGAASTPIESIAIPTNGSAEIADPANTGAQGNYQGNYQNGAIAASDGEWFYFCSGGAMYKMRLDGSERTQLTDVDCCSIGVIDGYIYYAAIGSTGRPENINRMTTEGTRNTTLYSGIFQDMMIVDGRIYFKNSLDSLKLYSIALDGTDMRCEGDIDGLYYLTLWNGKMYWANDEDGRHLYRANLDGSEAEKLTTSHVDSVTVVDGWIFYNDLDDHNMHLLNAETLEDHKVAVMGLYDPVISPYGFVGESSHDSLYLYRSELGVSGGNVLTDFEVDNISVVEGYIFFTNKDDGNVYMMDIYGDNLVQL